MGALRERVLVFDGAMGTMLQTAGLSLDDYQGLEGCSEILCVSRPDVVRDIHAAYFEAGADAVETNSFGSSAIVLAEYDIADQVVPLNRLAAAAGPGGGRRLPGRRAAALGGRVDRARDQAADAGPHHLRRPHRDLRRPGLRAAGGRGRPPADRDLPGPAPGQVGRGRSVCGHAAGRAPGPGDHPGDGGDDRPDAAGVRHRRRPDRDRAPRGRRDRDELRHRAGRDGRAPAVPGPARPHAAVVPAQRRAARAARRQALVPAHPHRAGRGPHPVRLRVRAQHRRRLLRHHPRAHPPGRGGPRPAGPRRPANRCTSPACPASTSRSRSTRTPPT